MAYCIEDIDWSTMPEGAVEFSLENKDYHFCWYNHEGQYQCKGVFEWELDYSDPYKLPLHYKVADYHPDMKVGGCDGEGQTLVGTICEVEDAEHGWIEAVALFYDHAEGCTVFKTEYGYSGYSNVRRIQSERDGWVDSVQKHFNNELHTVCPSESVLVGIYEGILSGKIKSPKSGGGMKND